MENNTAIKLSVKERIAYFFSDFGHMGLMHNFINTYIMFFYTDILGLSSGAAGVLLMVVAIFDALFSPVCGWICDRTRTRWGTYVPYVVGTAIPLCALMFLCFVAPDFTGGGKLAYAYIVYTLFSVLNAFSATSFGALPAVMTSDSREHVILGTFREYGNSFAGFMLNLSATSLLLYFSGNSEVITAGGIRTVAFLVACLACVSLLICGLGCKERIRPVAQPVNLIKSIKAIIKNKSAVCLILVVVCVNCLLVFKSTLTPYYCKHYLGSVENMTLIMTCMYTTPLLGLLFVPKLVSLVGNKMVFVISGIFAILSGALLLVGQTNIVAVCGASLCCGIVVACVFATIWGSVPDTADYGEWKTGVYCPAMLTACISFAIKVAAAIAQYGASLVLTITGYDATAAVQSAETVNALYLCSGLIPIILGALAIAAILPYDITGKKMEQIHAELAHRKSKTE